MRVSPWSILLLPSALPVGAAIAQLPPASSMTVGTAHSHSVSVPLSQMPVCPGATAPTAPHADASGMKPGVDHRRGFMPPPIVNFEGLNLAELTGGGCSLSGSASDDSGAVGPSHFI
jgi:hypothetical protein